VTGHSRIVNVCLANIKNWVEEHDSPAKERHRLNMDETWLQPDFCHWQGNAEFLPGERTKLCEPSNIRALANVP